MIFVGTTTSKIPIPEQAARTAARQALEKAGIPVESASVTMVPKNEVNVTAESARAVINLIEALEDHDDVQNIYANCDIPDEVLKELA